MRNKMKMKKQKTPEGLVPMSKANTIMSPQLRQIYQYPFYLKNLKNQVEMQETKAKSINMRNNILAAQKRANYINELERITGYLSEINPSIRHNVESLKKRKEELQRLAEQAV